MDNFLKITKKRLINHLQYSKLYYIGAIAIVLVVINLIYSATEPRYPKENTVNIMMYTGVADEDVLETWEKEMLALLPDDQREVNIVSTIPIDITTQSVVFARIAAKEDDILIIDKENINAYANQAAFLPLDEYMDIDLIYSKYPDVDWSEYWMKAEALQDDEAHIYWLPLGIVDGFSELGFSGETLGIAVLGNSLNIDNSITCVKYIMSK